MCMPLYEHTSMHLAAAAGVHEQGLHASVGPHQDEAWLGLGLGWGLTTRWRRQFTASGCGIQGAASSVTTAVEARKARTGVKG